MAPETAPIPAKDSSASHGHSSAPEPTTSSPPSGKSATPPRPSSWTPCMPGSSPETIPPLPCGRPSSKCSAPALFIAVRSTGAHSSSIPAPDPLPNISRNSAETLKRFYPYAHYLSNLLLQGQRRRCPCSQAKEAGRADLGEAATLASLFCL